MALKMISEAPVLDEGKVFNNSSSSFVARLCDDRYSVDKFPDIGWSNCFFRDEEDRVYFCRSNAVCYGTLHKDMRDTCIDKLTIFHSHPSVDEYQYREKHHNYDVESKLKWAKYVINEGMFSCVFLTKDLEEGFKNGFEIDTSYDYTIILAGLISLRWVLSFYSGSLSIWEDIVDHPEQAIYMSCKYILQFDPHNGDVYMTVGNAASEHHPYSRYNHILAFSDTDHDWASYGKGCEKLGTKNDGIWKLFPYDGGVEYQDMFKGIQSTGLVSKEYTRNSWGERCSIYKIAMDEDTLKKIFEYEKGIK